jgi:hypothetical protein
MPSVAIQTDLSHNDMTELQTSVRDLETIVVDQSIQSDGVKAKFHRWKGISQQLETELQHFHEQNQFLSQLAAGRERALRIEIQTLRQERAMQNSLIDEMRQKNKELAAQLAEVHAKPASKAAPMASHFSRRDEYQTLNHYRKFKQPSVEAGQSEVVAEKQPVQPTLPLSRLGKK